MLKYIIIKLNLKQKYNLYLFIQLIRFYYILIQIKIIIILINTIYFNYYFLIQLKFYIKFINTT